MQDLHFIQIQILKKLLFSPKLRYSDLRPENVENNLLNFHLNQLKDLSLIQKEDEMYSLTLKGKEFAGRMDTDKLHIQKQAKISAWIAAINDQNKEIEYLVYTRLKHPFYGCQGFLSGKVEYGESVVDAAKRELSEECGLIGEPSILQVKHYLVRAKESGELLEDKFMFQCLIKNPTGELRQSDEGKYEWVKESRLNDYVTNHFENWERFEEEVRFIKEFNGTTRIIEETYYSDKF